MLIRVLRFNIKLDLFNHFLLEIFSRYFLHLKRIQTKHVYWGILEVGLERPNRNLHKDEDEGNDRIEGRILEDIVRGGTISGRIEP